MVRQTRYCAIIIIITLLYSQRKVCDDVVLMRHKWVGMTDGLPSTCDGASTTQQVKGRMYGACMHYKTQKQLNIICMYVCTSGNLPNRSQGLRAKVVMPTTLPGPAIHFA